MLTANTLAAISNVSVENRRALVENRFLDIYDAVRAAALVTVDID